MESKWKFLGIKNVKYENLSFEDKKNVAKETWFIERLAHHFECEHILSLGDNTALKIKNEIIEKIKKDNELKAKQIQHKESNGLSIIKKSLGSN